MAVGVLRASNGFDFSDYFKCPDEQLSRTGSGLVEKRSTPSLQTMDKTLKSSSHCSIATPPRTATLTLDSEDDCNSRFVSVKNGLLAENSSELTTYLRQFQIKRKKAIIDVYWLFDDGGLTLLVPHLLATSKSYLEGANLRVFTISCSKNQLEKEQRSIASLMKKFRIEFADVFVIPDITRSPRPESLSNFQQLIEPFLDKGEGNEGFITKAELQSHKEKTLRQIRTRELMLKYSRDSTLIVLTMPIPRRNVCSSALFMGWLETLTHDLPPVLLLRGNQQSVLTFYS